MREALRQRSLRVGVGKVESWVTFVASRLTSLSAPLLPPIREAISLVCWMVGCWRRRKEAEKGWERKGQHLEFQEGWTSVVGVGYQASNQLQRETDKVESKEVKQSYLHFLPGLKQEITTSCKNPAKKMKEIPSAMCQRDRKSAQWRVPTPANRRKF